MKNLRNTVKYFPFSISKILLIHLDLEIKTLGKQLNAWGLMPALYFTQSISPKPGCFGERIKY